MTDPSIVNERVLHEVERWFRAKLRGETTLYPHEVSLFKALAERRNATEDLYTSRDGETLRHSRRADVEKLPTTRRAPADSQEELLRVSCLEPSLNLETLAGLGSPETRLKPPRPRRR